MNYRVIAAPLIGAVIGYITNAIAIKMLFRPSRPVYIGKYRLPFTPGLIPKEKSRLAAAIGKAVGENLLAADTVASALLSEKMLDKLAQSVDGLIDRARACEDTLGALGREKFGQARFDETMETWKARITDEMAKRLEEADIGTMAAKGATDYAKKKAPTLLANLAHGLLDDRVKQSVQGQIRDAVNEYVRQNAREALAGAINREAEALLETRLCDIVQKNEDRLPALREKLMEVYQSAVRTGLERVLRGVDIASIVRERIEGLDNMEMERMILNVIDRELKAIVWLGAALGCVMGFVNLLIP